VTSCRLVPKHELDRVIALDVEPHERAAIVADLCRVNALYMIRRAGSGHIGTSFSSLDISTWLHLEVLRTGATPDPERPLYFSSKGHDAPGTYAVLQAAGALPFDSIHTLRRLGGLPGHPDVGTPAIVTNTGSLGMGIAKAKGFAEADRLRGRRREIFVLTGDGELQEGQLWESLGGAVNRGIGQITMIVDHNKIQSDTWVRDVSDLGDLDRKLAAYGWLVERCDGHDIAAVDAALQRLRADTTTPGVLIADTVKGRGVSFMEGIPEGEVMYRFHSGAPAPDVVDRAMDEILARCDERLAALGADPVATESVDIEIPAAPTGQRLVAAYSAALCELGAADDRVVVLDGDLVLDTGALDFSHTFPERFIECGIAEQDMVSQAGALALEGFVPIVHSFACFLSTRPNEQIFNNATEHTKVIYAGSLAGVVPGGPGHSHQCVRDASAVGSVPDLVVAEPCCEEEVGRLLRAAVDSVPGSVYLRLVTPPVDVPYDAPASLPALGQGSELRGGTDGVIIAAGPVALSSAYRAAERLEAERGVSFAVVALPWLNRVDPAWLADVVRDRATLVTVENHVAHGGLGQHVLATLASLGIGMRTLAIAVDSIPACGRNDEVLAAHGLDADGVASSITKLLDAGS
jgi:transketolase